MKMHGLMKVKQYCCYTFARYCSLLTKFDNFAWTETLWLQWGEAYEIKNLISILLWVQMKVNLYFCSAVYLDRACTVPLKYRGRLSVCCRVHNGHTSSCSGRLGIHICLCSIWVSRNYLLWDGDNKLWLSSLFKQHFACQGNCANPHNCNCWASGC